MLEQLPQGEPATGPRESGVHPASWTPPADLVNMLCAPLRYMTPFLFQSILATTLLLGTAFASRADDVLLHPSGLRCEYLTDPTGLDETTPRLSWIDESSRRAERQTAYQVLVASAADGLRNDQGDLWDSGKVSSAESAHVVYGGRPLASRMACFWKVRVWDRDGTASAWSQPARWSMGLLASGDWQAHWIGGPVPDPAALPPITIQLASYEASDGTSPRDVAALLNGYVHEHRPDVVKVNADLLGGDPAPGKHKRLRVEFSRGGEHVSKTVAEGAELRLREPDSAVPSLRKAFTVAGKPRRATLYVTALGLYECRLNGQRVGDHVLAPDWTDYNRRVRYQEYDVTALVTPGENVLGALLANGWYAGHLGNGGFQQYGKTPALLAQLEITGEDGRVERIVTDGTWQTHASATTASDFMLGESCDARLETAGWDRPGSDVRDWTAATVREEKPRELDAQVCPPVRATAERRPVALTEPAPGHWTFDLGQNMVGVVRLKVTAPTGTSRHVAPRGNAQPRRDHLHEEPARRVQYGCLHLQGRQRGNMAAPIYFPRLPLRGSHRPAGQTRPRRRDRGRPRHGQPARGHAHLLGRADQPTRLQHRVGPARQLSFRAHGLPAARRAPGLDGRRAGVRPHSYGRGRRGRVLHQVARGRGRRAER